MIVYGDLRRDEDTEAKVERIRSGLAALEGMAPGIERHAEIVELLVEAGELEQGLLDDQLEMLGRERPTPLGQLSADLTRGIAEALLWSFRFAGQLPAWEGRKGAAPPLVGVGSAQRALRKLGSARIPGEIGVVVPEGYAFYGVYPEMYLRAAEQLRAEWPGALRVLGIRSIGTSLAAVVAAAGKGETSASVRPGGHPFARTLSIGERMTGKLLVAADATGTRRPLFAVVDEGPGLSGSSFGAMADWLEEHGVSQEQIVFLPSHRGPLGPHASERHRERWETARKYAVEFEEMFLGSGSPWSLERWVQDLTGPAEGPLEDIGAGRWRERLFPKKTSRPPAHLQQERRKYLLKAGGKTWLLKFAGLGRYGREKLELASELEKGGFTPPVAGLRHGFLVTPWQEDARPLPLVTDVDREALLDRVARYISFRARRLPGTVGASPEKLLEMAAFNSEQALGKKAAEPLGAWRERLPELSSLARPVRTDNRMHAWEWLVTPDGKIWKADALDHHASNDLVGAQDPAWDLAGAIVELELSAEEQGRLLEQVERSRRIKTPPDQLRFYTQAYLAFQLGYYTLAAQTVEGMDAKEAEALRKRAAWYAAAVKIARPG
ncbi:MAG TPA: hypothetical protein VF179_07065 [Thermoanaerobaculia bacterium]|nr:hypothetical protein [Thermoanaerobaculia bacterium]